MKLNEQQAHVSCKILPSPPFSLERFRCPDLCMQAFFVPSINLALVLCIQSKSVALCKSFKFVELCFSVKWKFSGWGGEIWRCVARWANPGSAQIPGVWLMSPRKARKHNRGGIPWRRSLKGRGRFAWWIGWGEWGGRGEEVERDVPYREAEFAKQSEKT